jgi:outer membrane lipoprotein-sorting protein
VAFNSPRTLVDTRFLSMGNAGGADNKVFMNNRIQRLNASGGSGKFAGTDFSYDDIASQKRKVDLDNHAVLREEELNGKSCYVIESSPKGAYQYAKMLQWIDKADSVLYKIEMYDNKNVQVKLYEVLEFRDQDGRYSPWKVKLSDLKTGSNTTMEVQELVYDKMIPDNLFSDRWLETAKYGLD